MRRGFLDDMPAMQAARALEREALGLLRALRVLPRVARREAVRRSRHLDAHAPDVRAAWVLVKGVGARPPARKLAKARLVRAHARALPEHVREIRKDVRARRRIEDFGLRVGRLLCARGAHQHERRERDR